MDQSSSGKNRGQGGPSRNRNRNRSGNRGGNRGGDRGGNRSSDNRSRNRSGGGRSRRRAPKPTGFQKFIKAITFGLVDPYKSKRKSTGRSGKPSGAKSKSGSKRRPPRSVEPTTPRLYVGNLDYGVSDEDLSACFADAGTVVSASVVRHGDSGRSKGFAFVEMTSLEEAKAAVAKLNDTDFKGRKMLVSGAKSEKPREGGEKRGGERRARSDRRGGERNERGGDRRGGRGSDRNSSDRRGGDRRGGDRGDRIEKPTRQAKAVTDEVVTSPLLLLSKINSDATDVDLDDLLDGIGTVVSRAQAESGSDSTSDYLVEFSDVAEAQSAVEFLHGKSFMGNQLKVTSAPADVAPVSAAPVEEQASPEEETVSEESPVPEESETPSEEGQEAVEQAAPAEVTADSPEEEAPGEDSPSSDSEEKKPSES